MKLLRNLVVVILVVVGVGVGVVMWQGESLVATGIEDFAPDVTGTTVTIGKVSIGPISGSAGLEDLLVGNPAGYSEPYALKLSEVSTKLNIRSLFSEKVIIHSIKVVDPEITFEIGKDGQNLTQINENVQAYVGFEAEEEASEPILFVIEDFLLQGAKVRVAGLGVKALNQEITLPDLHIQGIGEKENGVLAADAAKQIFSAVTALVQKELVKAQTLGILSDKLNLPGGSTVEKVKDKLKGFFKR